ncbi:hypothetical protein [Superficieibacter sp. HKU1]|uniref:hypothetical protein n=1 Tax=Superficieibacter sp. HKU1 TaxID=3031919 RepID=UPI0023E24C04|nr:hypothetical protein [Superficieibacter sp. HKU1]WES69880.1 hypothetical protein P0H77_07875 [Superficieibacter sp. HKU1]
MKNIKNSLWYDESVHKVHCPPVQSIGEIANVITSWVNKYGGKQKAKVQEIGVFSHAATDGPISVYTANNPPVSDCDCQLAIKDGWDKIDFNWAHEKPMCVFYGCNSGWIDGFSQKISALGNFRNVTVWGQSKSTFPSFLPNKRVTVLERTAGFGWDLGPTYMVGGKESQGLLAMTSGLEPDAEPLNFFYNGQYKGSSHQGVFNDHQKK